VVERRQQIGVLRAIGFRSGMVQLSFLIESSFLALSAIIVGTVLDLAVAYNFVIDARQSPSWSNLAFAPPWTASLIIFAAVYVIALATSYAPARVPGGGVALPVGSRFERFVWRRCSMLISG
jgi:putative ABC transport system permease protein